MSDIRPVVAIVPSNNLSKKNIDVMMKHLNIASEKTGYQFLVLDSGSQVQFDNTALLLEEQKKTNELLQQLVESIATKG